MLPTSRLPPPLPPRLRLSKGGPPPAAPPYTTPLPHLQRLLPISPRVHPATSVKFATPSPFDPDAAAEAPVAPPVPPHVPAPTQRRAATHVMHASLHLCESARHTASGPSATTAAATGDDAAPAALTAAATGTIGTRIAAAQAATQASNALRNRQAGLPASQAAAANVCFTATHAAASPANQLAGWQPRGLGHPRRFAAPPHASSSVAPSRQARGHSFPQGRAAVAASAAAVAAAAVAAAAVAAAAGYARVPHAAMRSREYAEMLLLSSRRAGPCCAAPSRWARRLDGIGGGHSAHASDAHAREWGKGGRQGEGVGGVGERTKCGVRRTRLPPSPQLAWLQSVSAEAFWAVYLHVRGGSSCAVACESGSWMIWEGIGRRRPGMVARV
eukprot:358710-Chlamydomonas_euryale.AAC.2